MIVIRVRALWAPLWARGDVVIGRGWLAWRVER
jgi:hypothetical protein